MELVRGRRTGGTVVGTQEVPSSCPRHGGKRRRNIHPERDIHLQSLRWPLVGRPLHVDVDARHDLLDRDGPRAMAGGWPLLWAQSSSSVSLGSTRQSRSFKAITPTTTCRPLGILLPGPAGGRASATSFPNTIWPGDLSVRRPALAVEVGIAVIVVIAACQYMKPDNFSKWSMATMGGLAALVLIALVAARPLLPTTTLRYDAMQLGAPVTGGDQPSNSPDIVLQGVLPGTYSFTLSYALMGSGGSGALIVSCNSASGAAPQSVSAGLNPSHVTKTVQLRCNQPGTVSAQLSVGAHSVLHVGSLRLQKIAA